MGAPSATVTFLITDVEGSTRRWQDDEVGMRAALARHDKILRASIEDAGGVVFSTMGDGVAAAFANASDAVKAALDAQEALAGVLPVRMGIHTGEAEVRDGDYFGTAVNRCARLMAVAHGGQLVCSSVTAGLVDGIEVADLGEHRLRDLDRPVRVFQVGEGRFPPLRSLDAFPGNLPLQLSSFIGRERELARVGEALAESRVVTLTGVGGVGKTRLALHVAADLLPRFSDGAWLVELAPVRDDGGVVDAVAGVFGVSARAGLSLEASLVDFLRPKQLLLIVDNCEHLLEPVTDLLDTLVQACPKLVVLATSQEGLGLDGERILVVASLGAPPAGAEMATVAAADAVRLFIDRARQVDAEFALTPGNASSVTEVCRRLDGVPLAIELAAARVGAMTPAELAAGLDRRFELFAGGRRKAVKRQQTLRATIDWSYELCSAPERRLLARLAVFAGGCTRDAVEAVCGHAPLGPAQVLGLLTSLVAKSLVVADRGDARTRYRLLETIREYGEERLDEHGETAELRACHADYYTTLVARLFNHGIPVRADSVPLLAAEQDNVARAMGWMVDTGDVDHGLQLLCSSPGAVYFDYGLELAAGPVLALPGAADHPEYPAALAVAALQAAAHGDVATGLQLCERALAAEQRLRTHPDGLVEEQVCAARGTLVMALGSWHEAALLSERAARIARDAGRLALLASHLWSAAAYHAFAGDAEAAIPLATEGVALARRIGFTWFVIASSIALANALADREPDRARALLREGLELGAAGHYEGTVQDTQAVLVAARLRDPRLALELAARVLPRLHWIAIWPQLAGVMNVVAWAAAATEPAGAAVAQGAARRVALMSMGAPETDAHVLPAPVTGAPGGAGLIVGLRRETTHALAANLGELRLRELRAEGEAMDADRAVAHALKLIDKSLATA